jgi:hypothetical protein
MDASEVFSRIGAIFDDGQLLTVCAWCGRGRIDDVWLALPRAVRVAIDERHAFSHSICDGCAEPYMTPVLVEGRDAPAGAHEDERAFPTA